MKTKKIPDEATTVLLLPECWIIENGEYIHLKDSVREKRLPRLGKSYENILRDMDIPYRVIEMEDESELLEYYSKNCYDERDLTLPLYEKLGEKYRYVGEHTALTPTLKMIGEAYLLWDKIEKTKKSKDEEDKMAAEEAARQKIINEVKLAIRQAAGIYSAEEVNAAEMFGNGIEVFRVQKRKRDWLSYEWEYTIHWKRWLADYKLGFKSGN